ncbi:hypothetical protein BGZ60DRAFT_380939 [Tricladium varicosporioides]|nr:hypothetical protein BGZ60DRAFT_380939 [Hymenoscyphus varicosporioides]
MNTFTSCGLRTAALFQRASSPAITSQFLSQSRLSKFTPLHRNASTSTSTTPSKSTTPSPLRSSLNGPLSTLPAPLVLPIRSEFSSTFKYLFKLGSTYGSFYKTGALNIFTNFRSSQPIQNSIDSQYKSSKVAAVKAGALSRADFQLLHRSWHDIKRLPIFGLVFIICGEFTPLVVIALSNIVPWTCRIPRQINSDRQKLEDRRRISFRNLTTTPPMVSDIKGLERQQLIHISWSLGLSSSVWDWLGGQYPGLPNAVLRRRVRRHVEYLEMDDALLMGRKGNQKGMERLKELDVEEVRMALVERGMDVLGKSEKVLRGDLEAWLRSREKAPVIRLLLTR